jgi:nucleotide-binding universal stress UspA family protein
MSFSHILAPTDLSAAANHALDTAFEEAEAHHATLILLHVLPSHSDTEVYFIKGAPGNRMGYVPESGIPLPTLPQPLPETVRHDFSEETLVQLQDLVPSSFTGTCEVEIAVGDPADAILRLAQERNVDLIVMGTHGRSGLPHVLLGSVAEKVVRLAPCPVLTVKAATLTSS